MKYQESYLGSKAEFGDWIKKTIPELFAGRLVIEGKTVSIPGDADLDYKVKYDEDGENGGISFKVTWEKESKELEIDD